MERLSFYLGRFKNWRAPAEILKQAIIKSLSLETGIVLETKDVVCRGAVVYLNISPAARSQIFIKKRQIIDRLKKESTIKPPRII